MCAVVAGIISPAAAGPPAVSDVIIGALRDAIAYRESGTAAIGCRACGDRYTGPRCGEHAEDSPRVLGYRRALQP